MQLRTNILEKLEEIINRNDDTVNGIIAQTILNFAKVPNETFIINDVAETSHTSVSSVTKFCNMLGFTGWKEFYIFFRYELDNLRKLNQLHRINPLENTIKDLVTNHTVMMTKLLNENLESILELKTMLKTTNKIYLIGEHTHLDLLINFYHQLLGLGFDTSMTTHDFIAKKFLEKLTKDDLVLWIIIDTNQTYLFNVLKHSDKTLPCDNIKFILKENSPILETNLTTRGPIIINDRRKMYTHQIIYNHLFIIFNAILTMLN
ncbi:MULTISPECIES: MurR/RpiR family transcriptional regulator [unclassified Spiroplasma]|uniref:MurR/RpiR family transcriptional regulator n=1 Tax=unclassified Spiroplasma TaxID=2637901 RepID=UPI0030CCD6F8